MLPLNKIQDELFKREEELRNLHDTYFNGDNPEWAIDQIYLILIKIFYTSITKDEVREAISSNIHFHSFVESLALLLVSKLHE